MLSLILNRLCSVATDVQYLCATLLLHLVVNREDRYPLIYVCTVLKYLNALLQRFHSFIAPEEWIQPLLLVKKFAVNPEVKK